MVAVLEWIKDNQGFALLMLVCTALAIRFVVDGFRKDDD
jgi:hypothetical protein